MALCMNITTGLTPMTANQLAPEFFGVGFLLAVLTGDFFVPLGALALFFLDILWPSYHRCDTEPALSDFLMALSQIYTIAVLIGVYTSRCATSRPLICLDVQKNSLVNKNSHNKPCKCKNSHWEWRWFNMVGILSVVLFLLGLILQGKFLSRGYNELSETIANPLGITFIALGSLGVILTISLVMYMGDVEDKNNTKYMCWLILMGIIYLSYDQLPMFGSALEFSNGIVLLLLQLVLFCFFYFWHKRIKIRRNEKEIVYALHHWMNENDIESEEGGEALEQAQIFREEDMDYLCKNRTGRFIIIVGFILLSTTLVMWIIDWQTRDVWQIHMGGSTTAAIASILIYVGDILMKNRGVYGKRDEEEEELLA